MKITPYEILNNVDNQKTSKSVNSTGQNFDDILRNQLNAQASTVSHAVTPSPIQSISKTDFSMIGNFDSNQNIEQVEQFLDTLEAYQKQLSNPSANLCDLNTLVSMLEDGINYVSPILDSLPDGNALKDVINRAVVTSTVELIKFNRGDYL